jgi:hypothetical protein
MKQIHVAALAARSVKVQKAISTILRLCCARVRTHRFVFLAAVFLFEVHCVASPIQIDFESVDLRTQFSRRSDAVWGPIQWSASGGVGNSGSLAVSSPHATVYKGSSVAFDSIGSKIALSTFFHTKDPGPLNPGTRTSYANVYLTRSPTGYRFVDHTAFVSVDILSDRERISGAALQAGGGSVVGAFNQDLPLGTITPGHWYELSVVYERLSGDQIGWQIDVNDYGADGLNYIETTISLTRQTPDVLGITTDSTLYAGFEATQRAVQAIDNFSLFEVPEPGMIMLGALAGLGLLWRRQRGT